LIKAAPLAAIAAPLSASAADASIELRIVRLRLKHTWTTTMSSSDYRDTLHVHYDRSGITGIGEGAPIVRYNESAAAGREALEPLLDQFRAGNPDGFDKLLTNLFAKLPGNYAAKAAVDIALMDWVTKKLGVPLCRYYGLDPSDAPITTFSIGIDTPEITRQKVREAARFPVLKIKVGLESDEATIMAVRHVTDKPLRVDANEGWTDKEVAIRKIEWLAGQGVEFVEQPMPAKMLEETRWLRDRSELPLIADEAVRNTSGIPVLAEAYDGVNVKLDKCGGVREAYRQIQMARALGMKTMLGCMISSSVSVTAAAHLSPLTDYADLDGNLLISNDPYRGVLVRDGKLILPGGPGLGLEPA
jgi:L-alanine-DL-glutamate epimerase-like enolase superfamily enzyme